MNRNVKFPQRMGPLEPINNVAEGGKAEVGRKFFTPGQQLKQGSGDGIGALLVERVGEGRGKENAEKVD